MREISLHWIPTNIKLSFQTTYLACSSKMIATVMLIKCIVRNAKDQSAYALLYHVRTLETKRIHAGDNRCLPSPLNLRHPFYNAGAMHIVTRTASWIPSSFVRDTPQLRFAVCECSSTLLTRYPCLLSFRWPGDEKNKGSLYECFLEGKILEKYRESWRDISLKISCWE